jgi:hypothetical protein
MRRREFIGLIGGAVTWPLAARAQQSPLQVIGFLSSASSESVKFVLSDFRRGLAAALEELGFATCQCTRVGELSAVLDGQAPDLVIAGLPRMTP